jgi:hypothetical protein
MLGFEVRDPETWHLTVPPEVNPQPRGAVLPISAVSFLSQIEGRKRLVAVFLQSPLIGRDKYGNMSMVSMEMPAATARELAQFLYAAAEEADPPG